MNQLRTALALSFAALMASPLAAQTAQTAPIEAPLPPILPWTGASEALIAKPSDPWITPIEQTGFVDTPDYAASRAWLDKLDAASDLVSITPFGTSAEGRTLYYVKASKGGARKPVLLVQAGIHAGEIDGKDAGMMLLRDIAFRGKDTLLDKVDLIFVPIFNVDGHERRSRFNRPNQRGPENMGWRATAQNLNLNRDYGKMDTPEMTAMIALINKLDPALYLDLHVTDGTDYQYDITYAFSGWDGKYAQSEAVGAWLNSGFRPAMDAALKKAGHKPFTYVNSLDNRDPDKGILHGADTARFSTGYGDRRVVPTVLLETHSLKPYRQRVLGTYIFIEQALKSVAMDAARIETAKRADRAARPAEIILSWKADESKPVKTVPFLSVAHEKFRSPVTGRDEIRWLGKPVTVQMPVWGEVPAVKTALPVAWWVPATKPDLIKRLQQHGIEMGVIATPQVLDLDMVRLSNVKNGRPSEGHIPLTADYTHTQRRVTMPEGSVRIPADQPLWRIAAALLEAESPDSFLSWGFFPEIQGRTEYMESYAIEPMAQKMLAADPALKAAYEKKLAEDAAFAKDANARLQWFYERSPYYDDRYLLYPVGREVKR